MGSLDVTAAELEKITAQATGGDLGMQHLLGMILPHRGDLDGAEK